MKCPKCTTLMFLGWLERKNHATLVVWVCPNCGGEKKTPQRQWAEQEYLCAFCHEYYHHTHTEDHLPIAKLICPPCAKKMHIELQTHPKDPENEDNPFFGC